MVLVVSVLREAAGAHVTKISGGCVCAQFFGTDFHGSLSYSKKTLASLTSFKKMRSVTPLLMCAPEWQAVPGHV